MAKLQVMVGLGTERLLKVSAWPIDTLHDQPGGPVTGILMPRILGHKQIHMLYSPKTRLSEFPQATWPFLIRTAANLARAFDVVHRAGLVVGDVNHGNVGVSDQATVKFYDCDSFQVIAGGQQFLCEVGISTHTPPELQGKSFRGLVRTANHDLFGMAVLIFQLLFMGRHPFAGVHLAPGDSTIEQAIAEFRFAYGPGAAARKMRPPPATLPLEAVSQPVAELFERAFGRQGATRGRPNPQEWIVALGELEQELRQCSRGHHHVRTLAACPWCAIEGQIGRALFAITISPSAGTAAILDIASLWAQIAAVPAPGPAPPLPRPSDYAMSPDSGLVLRGRRLKRARYYKAVGLVGIGTVLTLGLLDGLVAFLALVALLVGVWQYVKQATSPLRREVGEEAGRVQMAMDEIERRWRTEAGEGSFHELRQKLEAVRNQLDALPNERQRKVRKLQGELRERQLRRYLDRFRIEDASIKGIGHSRKATLQSWGIETAADIDLARVLQVPGIGPALADRLVDWRQKLESRFVFDPSRGLDPADLGKVDSEIAQKRTRLEKELSRGLQQLHILRQRILDRRAYLYREAERVAREAAQIEANLKAL